MVQKYKYRARNKRGKIVRGIISAESSITATGILRQKDLYVVDIKPVKGFNLFHLTLFHPRVTTKDLALFCRQFSTMVTCGIPIIQCLNILIRQTGNKRLANAVRGMIEMLEKGQSLSDTAGAYPGVFPRIFVSMLHAGEVGGSLDAIMERLADHFEKEHDLREKIKSAMTYPALVAVVALLALAAQMVFILPTFIEILIDYNARLPLATQIVLGTSNFIRHYWYIIAGALVILAFVCKGFVTTRRGRVIADTLVLRLPVFGGLIRRMIISRFSRTLSILLASGVPLLQSFDVVKKVAGNSQVESIIAESAERVREGQDIARPLERSGFFPPMVTRVISIGEETGTLDVMLKRMAQFYDREVDYRVARLSSAMEPLLVLSMGLLVGFIMLSVMLPLFSIVSSID